MYRAGFQKGFAGLACFYGAVGVGVGLRGASYPVSTPHPSHFFEEGLQGTCSHARNYTQRPFFCTNLFI